MVWNTGGTRRIYPRQRRESLLCAMENEKDLGFLYLKETGKDTVELAVMGVLKEYHRKGIGKELLTVRKRLQKKWAIHLFR